MEEESNNPYIFGVPKCSESRGGSNITNSSQSPSIKSSNMYKLTLSSETSDMSPSDSPHMGRKKEYINNEKGNNHIMDVHNYNSIGSAYYIKESTTDSIYLSGSDSTFEYQVTTNRRSREPLRIKPRLKYIYKNQNK